MEKDPRIEKLEALTAKMDKVVRSLLERVNNLEIENKKLRAAAKKHEYNIGALARRG